MITPYSIFKNFLDKTLIFFKLENDLCNGGGFPRKNKKNHAELQNQEFLALLDFRSPKLIEEQGFYLLDLRENVDLEGILDFG